MAFLGLFKEGKGKNNEHVRRVFVILWPKCVCVSMVLQWISWLRRATCPSASFSFLRRLMACTEPISPHTTPYAQTQRLHKDNDQPCGLGRRGMGRRRARDCVWRQAHGVLPIAGSDEAFVEATIPMQQAEHTFTPMRPLRVARKPPSCCLDVLAVACVELPPPPGLLPRTRSSSSSSLPNTNPHNAHYHCTHTPCCRPSLFYPLLLPLTNSLLSSPRHTSTATSPPLHLSNALTTPPTHPHQHHQHGGPRKNGPARHPFLLPGRRANDRVL